MHPKFKVTIVLSALLLFFAPGLSLAQESFPFTAEVLANDINIRSDSTVNSQVICQVNKGERLTVVSEHYDWYKVVLPKDTPVFIKGDLVAMLDTEDTKSAKVTGDRVNIRMGPSDSSPVIGMVGKDQPLNVLDHSEPWYKIESPDSCFGWIHKQFVKKATQLPKVTLSSKPQQLAIDSVVTIEGVVNHYGRFLRRTATHKIVTPDKKIFLLKGSKESLDAAAGHKVKITGNVLSIAPGKYPIIEVTRLEQLD
jgi:uncharacterized protein YgiM (DUF1202 family)